MVERRSRRGTQATIPTPAVITKRRKNVIPSSEKSRHHEAEIQNDGVHGAGDVERMQTPELTTRKLRSDALKADPIDTQDTPSFLQRNVQFATPGSIPSDTPDPPRGGSLDGHDFENPEQSLRSILSQEDYETWERLISELKRRGPRLPSFRIQRTAVLRDFFGHHSKAISLHDRYARAYNKDYEGKHERFHLPVLQEVKVEKVRVSEAKEIAQIQRPSRRMTVSKPATAHVLAMQYDGAMDVEMEGVPQLTDETEIATPAAADKKFSSIHREEDIAHEAELEKDDAAVDHRAWPTQEAVPAADDTENFALEPRPAHENIAQLDTEAGFRPLEAGVMIDMREGQDADTSDKDAQHQSVLPMTLGEDHAAADIGPAVVNSSAQTKPTAAVDLIPATDPTSHVAEDPSTQSYLVWLHQRQTRFPIAEPNHSECVALAQKLGRPTRYIYDEIVYRWGLETDSRWGDWYKQNRLQVLGEDPRFDEETMGQWEAWLKQGDILDTDGSENKAQDGWYAER